MIGWLLGDKKKENPEKGAGGLVRFPELEQARSPTTKPAVVSNLTRTEELYLEWLAVHLSRGGEIIALSYDHTYRDFVILDRDTVLTPAHGGGAGDYIALKNVMVRSKRPWTFWNGWGHHEIVHMDGSWLGHHRPGISVKIMKEMISRGFVFTTNHFAPGVLDKMLLEHKSGWPLKNIRAAEYRPKSYTGERKWLDDDHPLIASANRWRNDDEDRLRAAAGGQKIKYYDLPGKDFDPYADPAYVESLHDASNVSSQPVIVTDGDDDEDVTSEPVEETPSMRFARMVNEMTPSEVEELLAQFPLALLEKEMSRRNAANRPASSGHDPVRVMDL